MNSTIEPLVASLRDTIAANPLLAKLDLLPLVRPSIRLVTKRVPDAELRVGESRIGGFPDVPSTFEWPCWLPSIPTKSIFGQPWQPSEPAPLGFIAQIDLSALPRIDNLLPTTGWLYFFYDRFCEPWGYDPADRGSMRIIYLNCDRSKLIRTKPPADAYAEHIANPCSAEARPELTLPDDLPNLEYDTPEYEAYEELREQLAGTDSPQHRWLGHPQTEQNPMELECQLASNGVYCGDGNAYQSEQARLLGPGAADWRLLLQVDTDEEGPGWMWGDAGKIYFWIKKQDLKDLRFDDAWLVLQCG